jgi:hypothetical protein
LASLLRSGKISLSLRKGLSLIHFSPEGLPSGKVLAAWRLRFGHAIELAKFGHECKDALGPIILKNHVGGTVVDGNVHMSPLVLNPKVASLWATDREVVAFSIDEERVCAVGKDVLGHAGIASVVHIEGAKEE